MASISQRKGDYVSPHILLTERKFDTAIRSSLPTNFLKRVKNDQLTFDDKLITTHKHVHELTKAKARSTLFAVFVSDIFTRSNAGIIVCNKQKPQVADIMEVVYSATSFQWQHILDSNMTISKQNILKLLHNYLLKNKDWTVVNSLLNVINEFDRIINKLPKMEDHRYQKLNDNDKLSAIQTLNSYRIKELQLELVWSRKLVYISYKRQKYILPRPYIQMIHNKLCDIVSILIYSQLASGVNLDENAYNITVDFLTELTVLAINFREDFYTILKTLEALSIAETLAETEKWINNEFKQNTIDELREDTGFEYNGSGIAHILQNCSIPLRSELCCLSKVLGHPLVNMYEGSETLHKKVTEPLPIDISKVHLSVLYAKENYIRNYILRHKKWPQVEPLEIHAPLPLRMAYLRGIDPNSREIKHQYGKVDIADYDWITLMKNMNYTKLENYLPYLKDKTISVLRSKVMKGILDDQDDDKQSWKETRLLLFYFCNPKIVTNHIDYLDKYDDSTTLDELLDYLVIRIVPKEKELKILFRGFGCKTYYDRIRAHVQEKNAMHFLDMYSDEQAMTLSELDLLKRLYAWRTLSKAYKDHKVLYINLDASSWNNRFRHTAVSGVMSQTLDRIFGVHTFAKTHMAYEKSLIYVPDEAETHWWDGQLGGIEGLNQDTWVVTYLAQIKVALSGLGYQYHILCRGDDVRLAIIIPPTVLVNKNLKEIAHNAVVTLKTVLQDFGHKLKIMESYASENYLAFSKVASLGPIELPMAYRKITRSHGSNNSFIPTLDEYIGATFSNAHSSCKVSPTVTQNYMTGLFWTVYYLKMHPVYTTCTNKELFALTLIPSIVGGFPIIYLANMFVRAESDLLSPFISLLQYAKKKDYELASYMQNFMVIPTDAIDNYISLYKDPYSLPSDRPTLPSTVLRTAVEPNLVKIAKNEDILELIKAKNSEDMQVIVDALDSITPLNVRVASAIYNASPAGVFDQLLRQFEAGRSIYELIILRSGKFRAIRILTKVLKQELILQNWRLKRLRGFNQGCVTEFYIAPNDCPAFLAQAIRCQGWKREIEGVTMPPLQHQLALKDPCFSYKDPWAVLNHFTYTYRKPTIELPRWKTPHYMSSNLDPFLGFITRTGTVGPEVQFAEKDAVLIKLKNLLEICTWTSKQTILPDGTEVSSNIHELIIYIIKMYTDVDIRTLAPFAGKQKSGTIQHHLRSPSFKEAIVPNILSNIYQQFIGISNTHHTFRNSEGHFLANFLHIMCYSIMSLSCSLEFSTSLLVSDTTWAITTDCLYCSKPIMEVPMRFNEKILPKVAPSTIKSLSVVDGTHLLIHEAVTKLSTKTLNEADKTINLTYEEACAGVVQEFIDNTYTQTSAIMDRYGLDQYNHELQAKMVDMTMKTTIRNIGFTELKHLSLNVFITYIVPKIAWDVSYLYPGIYKDIAVISMLNYPGVQLPWYNMCVTLEKGGLLGSVVQKLQELTQLKIPMVFCNPASAAQFIGSACYILFETHPAIPHFVLLSNYLEPAIFRHIQVISNCLIKRFIKNQFCKEYHGLQRQPLELRHLYDMTDVTRKTILLLTLNLMDEEVRQNIMAQLNNHSRGQFQLISQELINPYLYEEPIWEVFIDQPNCKDLKIFSERYYDAPWAMAYADLQYHAEEIVVSEDEYFNFGKCSITLTTLDSCIRKIRSHPLVINEDFLHIKVDKSKNLDTILPTKIITKSKSDRLKVLHTSTNIIPYMNGKIAPYNFESTKLYLDVCHIHKVYGHGTSSLNKIIDIFELLCIPEYLGENLSIACLGEGYGGILNFLASCCKSSFFLFNTLPPQGEQETRPELALQMIKNNHHELQYQHLLNGFYDLTNHITLMHYEEYCRKYEIITCDAEVFNLSKDERTTLVQNVLAFYFKNRAINGLLILKMNVAEGELLHLTVGMLEKYSRHVYLVHCRSSNLGGEIYVVSYGTLQAYYEGYRSVLTFPGLVNFNNIEKFRKLIFNKWYDYINTKNRVIQLPHSISTYKSKYIHHGLSSNGAQKLGGIIGVTITEKHVHLLEQSITYQNGIVKIFNALMKVSLHIKRLIDGLSNQEQLHAHWDTNTLTHHLRTIERFLGIQGALLIIEQLMKRSLPSEIHEKSIRMMYCSQIELMPPRAQLYPVTACHYSTECKILNIKYTGYARFLQGVHYSLSLIGYCMAHNSCKIW